MNGRTRLWELIRNFARAYWGTLLLYGAACAIFSLLHWLGGGRMREALYALILCAALLLAVGALCFAYFAARQTRLWQALEHPPEDADGIPESHTPFERDFRALTQYFMQTRAKALADADAKARERDDYYTLWMHQIKTPLAALDLMAQSDGPIDRGLMRQEVLKISQYADCALTYQRLDSLHRDLDLSTVPLYPLCCRCVKKLRALFLYGKISLVLKPFDESALTDAKWMGVVLTQILTNALKYTPPGGTITVRSVQPGVLEISDTGIGVLPEDVPRVFERGFTGRTGRRQDKSTGIGLYLCKRVCDELGHKISLSSVPGQGVTVTLDMRRENYTDM